MAQTSPQMRPATVSRRTFQAQRLFSPTPLLALAMTIFPSMLLLNYSDPFRRAATKQILPF
jgi:hypothetical protein